MKKFPSRESAGLMTRTLKCLQIRRATLFTTLFAVLLSTFTFVNQSPARADTAGTGACAQTFTKSGTGTVDIVESGGYCYVAFKNSGAVGFQTSYSWTRPTSVLSVDALVIGGGGGGGSRHGGGGGAGAFVESTNFVISSASSVAIVVGAGGAGAAGNTSYVGSRGQTSSFISGSNGLTAISGGAGVNGTGNADGGSGGGSGWNQTAGFVTTSPPQTQTSFAGATLSGITFGSKGAQGAKEGDGSFDYWAGGGGGGATADGANPTSNGTATAFYSNGVASTARGGNGGSGKISTILPSAVATSLSVGQVSSSNVYFSGGGGGGMGADGAAGGTGGLGGGANGTRVESTGNNGAANTGGGGGGSGYVDIGASLNPEGGDGGSGVVVIRYTMPTTNVGSGVCAQTYSKEGTGTVTVSEVSGRCYIAFRNAAIDTQTSFTLNKPASAGSIDYLVVAGGGGGGLRHAGGGGAGGLLKGTLSISSLSTLSLTVGGGGAGRVFVSGQNPPQNNNGPGATGKDSVLETVVAKGGGAGTTGGDAGGAGGSGGGARSGGGQPTSGQGNAGGGGDSNNTNYASGGGGGAGSAGSPGSSGGGGGAGGSGAIWVASFTKSIAETLGWPSTSAQYQGDQVFFAGGGGGGSAGAGAGTASAGGGAGNGSADGADALASSGGGGGGSGCCFDSPGGDGGSGVIIISYMVPIITFNANDGTATPATTTQRVNSGVATALTANAFTRSGFIFSGWTASTNGTGATYTDSQSVTLTENLSLFAKWIPIQTVDSSLELSGTVGQYGQVSSGQIIPATGAFTAQVWFKPAADVPSNSLAILFSQGSGANRFYLKRAASGAVVYYRDGGGAEANCGTSSANVWSHAAITYSSGTLTCYLNGVQQSTLSANTSISTGFVVGEYSASLGAQVHAWKGSIDEVRVYNTARTGTQIAADAHAYATVSDSTLVAYYDFNEGSGTTIFNKKTAAASTTNLTLSGSPTFADVAETSNVNGRTVKIFKRSYLNNAGGWTVPDDVSALNYLVVGGGGGGGIGIDTAHGGGGGGAGGYRTNVSGATSGRNSSAEASFTVADTRYPVVVGFGGSAQPSRLVEATNGGSSTFATITSLGGGRGANYYEFSATVGGSGGGGAASSVVNPVSRLQGAAGTTAQGFAGGDGHNDRYGAGGGGAGSAGSNATSSSPGSGGAGLASTISGSSVTRAAGGIGGHSTTGGAGVSGAANTGNGGSGGNVNSGTIQTAGSGGAGVVILSYGLENQAALTVTSTTGTNGSTLALTTSGGSGSGAVTFTANAGTAGCSVSGSTLSFTSAGTCTVTATKASADGFASVSSSATTITVNAATYTVTYNYNNATGGNGTASAVFTAGGSALTLPVPARTGYTLAGWFEDSGFSGSAIGLTYSPTQSRTIYAKWTGNKYSYNANTGSNAPADQIFSGTTLIAASGSSVTAPTGYSFGNWCTTQPSVGSTCGGTSYASGANLPTPGSSTVTLFAVWTGNPQTITYAPGISGTGTGPTTPATVAFGSTFTTPANTYSRNGYAFAGWSDGTNVFAAGVTYPTTGSVSTDVTLTATWTANTQTITYAPGTSGTGTGPTTPATVAFGSTFTTPANTYLRNGYAFAGWSDGTNVFAAGVTYPTTGSVGADVTLTATWSANAQNITYAAGTGGTGAGPPSPATVLYDASFTTPANTYLRTGYTFAGWSDGTSVFAAGARYPASGVVTAPVTLTATWTGNSNTVTFKSNYTGGPADSTQSITTDAATNLTSNTFTLNGYTFVGWTTNADGTGTSYTNGQSVTLTGALTLHAKWSANAQNITYAAGTGGTGTGPTTPATVLFDAWFTTPVNTYNKTGYTFSGWSDGSNVFTANVRYPTTGGVTGPVTLTATWTANPQNITYAPGTGGTGTGPTSPASVLYDASFTTPANTFNRTGYTFAGWNDGSAVFAAGARYPASGVVTAPATLTATWAANLNTVTFKSNYTGGPADSTQSITTDVATNLTSNTLTLNGYTFVGWTTNADGTGTSYTNNQSVTLTGALTLHAKWSASAQNITYSAGTGGTGTGPSSPATVLFDAWFTTPVNTYNKTGYTFAGWSDGSNVFTANVRYPTTGGVTGPVTLTATWTANSNTVTFNSNYGTPTTTTQSITTDAATNLTSNSFSRTGYTFAGWTANADGTGTSYTNNQSVTITGALTLYAKWTANSNTVTFNSNYGTPTTTTQSITTATATNLSANTFSRTGYTFAGWTANADGTGTSYTNSQSVTLTGGLTLYAKWTASTNTVTFNSNYGTPTTTTQSITTDTATNLTANSFSRTGYTFAGWTANSDGTGTSYTNNQSVTITGGMTLFAKWTANSNTVTFNSNYGTPTTTTQSITTDASTALTSNTFTRTGYTFAGWTANADGTGTSYTNGQSVTLTGGLTLYAKWTANAQSITYLPGVGGSGTGPSTPATVLYDATFTTPANTFTRTGYSFAGWSDGTSVFAAGTRYPATGVVTGPVSLVATWTANAQNITYAAGTGGSGTGPTTPATVLYDASFTTPANTFTRAGYTFAGWSDGTTVFAASARYPASGGVTGPVTLTATWSAGSNVVTYDSKGGSPVANGSFVSGGSIQSAPTDPTRTGYIFDGWTATDGGTTVITFPYSPTATSGITLYAKWIEITYTITYVVNGATGSPERSTDTYTYTGGAVTLSNVGSMAKTGYRFDGWQLNGTTTKLSSSYTPLTNVTLQARWAAVQYTITYFSNSGGTPPVADSYTTGDAALILPTQGSMARTGYTFNGWSTTVNNVSTKVAATLTTTAPVNLFALWTAVPYSVTYSNENSTGGSVPSDTTSYNIGNTLIVKANSGTLVRTGYSFAGWTFISGGSGTTYQSGDTYTVGSADLTFFPKWTANTYNISYNANGASGTPARTSDTYTTAGSTISLPNAGTMTKTGYNFAGWSTSSTGSVHSGAFTTSSDVTLFAIWTIKTIPYGYDRGVAKGTNLTGSHVARFPSPSSMNSTYGATVTLPAVGSTSSNISETATVTGSTFKFFGWSDGDVTYSPGASYVVPDLVAPATRHLFTAQWVELLAVRYALNGGSGIVDIDPECIQAGDKCLANQVIVLSEAPTRDGYTFAGWRNQANTETKLAGASVTVTDTSYLWYAQWTAIPYEISFNSVGGSLSPATQTKNIGDSVTLPDPGTKTGYTFDGWLVSSTKHGIDTTYSVGTSNVAFTAVWTANRYNVSYNWNGGSGSGSSGLIYTVGTTPITLPTGNARDGYVFDGWQVSTTTTKLGSTFAPTADTLLEARWIDGAYTLTFDNFNGSSNTSASVTRATATTLPTPTRTGFTFDGWYEDANYTLRYGAGGASVIPTTSKSLTAKWVQNSLAGINPAHLRELRSASIQLNREGATLGGTHSTSSTGFSLDIPDGAFEANTVVKVSFVEDLSRPARLIENNNAYFTSVVVHWLTGVDAAATVPTASSPLTLTLTNPAIVSGAKVFKIVNGAVTEVATATADGRVEITFTEDPEFVVAATRPGSPTAVTATNNQNARSTISWNAPLGNGGSAITGYTATASPGGATCTTTGTSCQITGLTNGISHTLTVKARNAIGDSLPSSPSSAITPRLALNYSVIFNSNGGSAVGNGSFVENGTLSAPTDPTRANFNFIGWATTDGNESTIISFPYSPTNANLTLYAIWRANNPALNPDNSGNNGAVITPISTNPSATPTSTPKASASAKPSAKSTSSAKPTSSPSPAATPEATAIDIFANAPKPGSGINIPQPGKASAIVGDESVETVVTVTEFKNQIEIGNSISISFQATDAAGNLLQTSPDGSVQVVQGATISAIGSGFKPGSPVEAWLYSTPTLLGTGIASADGSFDSTFGIKPEVPLGNHTVVLHGVSPEDEVITLALGVTVIENTSNPQVVSGSDSSSGFDNLILGLMALLGAFLTAGLGLLAVRVMRKPKK